VCLPAFILSLTAKNEIVGHCYISFSDVDTMAGNENNSNTRGNFELTIYK